MTYQVSKKIKKELISDAKVFVFLGVSLFLFFIFKHFQLQVFRDHVTRNFDEIRKEWQLQALIFPVPLCAAAVYYLEFTYPAFISFLDTRESPPSLEGKFGNGFRVWFTMAEEINSATCVIDLCTYVRLIVTRSAIFASPLKSRIVNYSLPFCLSLSFSLTLPFIRIRKIPRGIFLGKISEAQYFL